MINPLKQRTTPGKALKGQVLVECVLTFSMVLLTLAFLFEMIRMGERHSLFQYLCFLHNREIAFGNKKREAISNQKKWLNSIFSEKETYLIAKEKHFDSVCLAEGLKTFFRYRYQGYFNFLNSQERFQINKACTFSFS
jgi:hypothetical protein